MKNMIPKHENWNGKLEWNRRHSSGLFGLVVSVHGERDDHGMHCPPRYWNTYLVGGDVPRWARDEKLERWVEKCPVTEIVFREGEGLFKELPWNGEQTFFRAEVVHGGPHPGIRHWKVGDDYAHLWDGKWNAWNDYDFEMMQRRIEAVGDAFAEMIKRAL